MFYPICCYPVLHVPSFSFNLISVSALTKDLNCSVTFFPTHCVFHDLKTGQVIGGGRESNGLYLLKPIRKESRVLQSTTSEDTEIMLWHHRLGHALVQSLRSISTLQFKNNVQHLNRDTCQFAKTKRNVCPVSINKRSMFPFDLIHSDISYAPLTSIYGYRYFVTFIDDPTRCTWVYRLKSKGKF